MEIAERKVAKKDIIINETLIKRGEAYYFSPKNRSGQRKVFTDDGTYIGKAKIY